MSAHLKKRELIIKNGRNRTPRPKTFKTEQAAQDYAKKQGIKKFTLVNLRSDASSEKKIRVVVQ
ncbi:MAG: hypothetical protein ACMXYF_00175 [Candidatus Woesearchaeota archaeon]